MRYWSEQDDEALRRNAKHGPVVIAAMLERSPKAVRQRANLLGVKLARAPRSGHGDHWRGNLKVPNHAHPLVRRLVAEMNRERTTFDEVSERSGVGVSTIKLWRTRRRPYLDNFIAALNAIDLDLTIIHRREEAA